MAEIYTFSEQTDMILVLGFCEGNYSMSSRVYHEKFPDRRVPSRKTFKTLERRLREQGSFKPLTINRGRPRTARNACAVENILQTLEDVPGTSTRQLSVQFGTNKTTVQRVIKEELLRPYHVQKVQELLPLDANARLRFCRTIQERRANDQHFHKRILFTDEACFTRRGIINMHNEHEYAYENPHAIRSSRFQHDFKINVWAGIIGNFLIGPVILPDRLSGASYLNFLENSLPELLEDLPLVLRGEMWFLHDGAPPHYTVGVRNHLHHQFAHRWIGRGADAPINWPARSPDLNLCDTFLWGTLKNKVYSSPINDYNDLWTKIQNAAQSIKENGQILPRVEFNFLRRIHLCIQENGGHFEHLLQSA